MSDAERPKTGAIVWTDLTVPDAEKVRDFYRAVVGWDFEPIDMGDYSDFTMISPQVGQAVAGICHARGSNADLPPQWLLYITVDDVGQSASRCVQNGGEVLLAPRSMAEGSFCVIRDPSGAVCALFDAGDGS
jgi:predicted enzyme related to lactoylglutathione lyase